MLFWILFLIIGGPVSVYALDEPAMMKSINGALENFYYLTDERQKLEYTGPPSNYETGVKLIRVDEMDKENGAYKLVFWHWVKINEKNDPTNFVCEDVQSQRIQSEMAHMLVQLILVSEQIPVQKILPNTTRNYRQSFR